MRLRLFKSVLQIHPGEEIPIFTFFKHVATVQRESQLKSSPGKSKPHNPKSPNRPITAKPQSIEQGSSNSAGKRPSTAGQKDKGELNPELYREITQHLELSRTFTDQIDQLKREIEALTQENTFLKLKMRSQLASRLVVSPPGFSHSPDRSRSTTPCPEPVPSEHQVRASRPQTAIDQREVSRILEEYQAQSENLDKVLTSEREKQLDSLAKRKALRAQSANARQTREQSFVDPDQALAVVQQLQEDHARLATKIEQVQEEQNKKFAAQLLNRTKSARQRPSKDVTEAEIVKAMVPRITRVIELHLAQIDTYKTRYEKAVSSLPDHLRSCFGGFDAILSLPDECIPLETLKKQIEELAKQSILTQSDERQAQKLLLLALDTQDYIRTQAETHTGLVEKIAHETQITALLKNQKHLEAENTTLTEKVDELMLEIDQMEKDQVVQVTKMAKKVLDQFTRLKKEIIKIYQDLLQEWETFFQNPETVIYFPNGLEEYQAIDRDEYRGKNAQGLLQLIETDSQEHPSAYIHCTLTDLISYCSLNIESWLTQIKTLQADVIYSTDRATQSLPNRPPSERHDESDEDFPPASPKSSRKDSPSRSPAASSSTRSAGDHPKLGISQGTANGSKVCAIM
jgi:hypothetical protein